MKIEKSMLCNLLFLGVFVVLGVIFSVGSSPLTHQYWSYFNYFSMALGALVGLYLWGAKDDFGRCMSYVNWAGAVLVALGQFKLFNFVFGQGFILGHAWGIVQGFILASWILTACYLKGKK
jgi:hypothetical protein